MRRITRSTHCLSLRICSIDGNPFRLYHDSWHSFIHSFRNFNLQMPASAGVTGCLPMFLRPGCGTVLQWGSPLVSGWGLQHLLLWSQCAAVVETFSFLDSFHKTREMRPSAGFCLPSNKSIQFNSTIILNIHSSYNKIPAPSGRRLAARAKSYY